MADRTTVWTRTLNIFKGSSIASPFSQNDGQVTSIVFSDPLSVLETSKYRILTPGSQKDIDPTDTSSDYLGSALDIRWGE